MSKIFVLRQNEKKDYEFDWSNWLEAGDSIASGTVSASPLETGGLVVGSPTVGPTSVIVILQPGVSDHNYTISNNITTANGLKAVKTATGIRHAKASKRCVKTTA